MATEFDRSEALEALGKHLAAKREAYGINGAELARRCFLDRQAIDRIEKGKTNPTFVTLKKIALALECTVEELLKGAGV